MLSRNILTLDDIKSIQPLNRLGAFFYGVGEFVEQNGQFVEKNWLLPYIILILQPEIDSQFI